MTAVNRHLALNDEFETDPLAYGYTGMTDQQRYDSLKVEDIPVLIPIQSQDIILYLESVNKWNQMSQLSVIDQSQTPPVPRNDSAYHMRLVIVSIDSFDMNNPTSNQVLTDLVNSLVANNVLTQQEADDLLALGDSFISRDTDIGVNDVTPGEVEQARTV